MAVGQRFVSGGARGIARFLAEHEPCRGGFEVGREGGAGDGRLVVACRGCGQRIEYRAAETADLVAGAPVGAPGALSEPGPLSAGIASPPGQGPGTLATVAGATNGTSPEFRRDPFAELRELRRSAPARVPPQRPAPTGAGRRRPVRRARSLPAAAIAMITIAGVGLIVAGLLTDEGESGGEPTATDAPTVTRPGATLPAEPVSTQPQTRSFAGLFAVDVPVGWTSSRRDGAVVLSSPGRKVGIEVFFEPGTRSLDSIAASAGGFLAARNPGVRVGAPQPAELAGREARRVRAGDEIAFALQETDHSYVIVARVDPPAGTGARAQAEAALRSFTPL